MEAHTPPATLLLKAAVDDPFFKLEIGNTIAQQASETVVFEKDDRIGGLLRDGIPDFKLEKRIIDRRLEQMSREGVRFQSGVAVGRDITAAELRPV